MKKKMSLLMVALMIVVLFAGCGSNGSQVNSGGQVEKSKFADREAKVGFLQVTSNFDITGVAGLAEYYGWYQIYDSLVTFDKDRKIVGSLADKYEISPDGKTYTFSLKKGVKFSNGLELKAADVKFSIEACMKGSNALKTILSTVTSCEVVDDYTVKINLKAVDVSFLEKITKIWIVNQETVKKYGDQYGKTAEASIGTGAYIVKEWKPKELCVLEANPNYFKGAPNIKKLRFKTISDANAAIIALQTGEIDLYMNDIPGIAYKSIANDTKLNIGTFEGSAEVFTFMNTEKGAFADVRMRKAVAYALDRQNILTIGCEGLGTIVNSPGGANYTGNSSDKTWIYNTDIEKAKQLVKEAGMEGKTIKISTVPMDPFTAVATVIQSQLTKIGLKAEVEQKEVNTFINDLGLGNVEIAVTRYTSMTQDLGDIMLTHLNSKNIGAAGNYCRYNNPAMDQLLEKASSEMNPETRKKILADAVKIFTDDVPEIPLYYQQGSRAYTKDLVIDKGYLEYGTMYYYNWKE